MKIAVTAEGSASSANVDPRFGRARYFLVFDTETEKYEAHDNVQNVNAAQGAGIQAGQTVARLGAQVVITGNMGPKAFDVLTQAGIKIFLIEGGTVEKAIADWKNGALTEVGQPSKPGHWM